MGQSLQSLLCCCGCILGIAAETVAAAVETMLGPGRVPTSAVGDDDGTASIEGTGTSGVEMAGGEADGDWEGALLISGILSSAWLGPTASAAAAAVAGCNPAPESPLSSCRNDEECCHLLQVPLAVQQKQGQRHALLLIPLPGKREQRLLLHNQTHWAVCHASEHLWLRMAP